MGKETRKKHIACIGAGYWGKHLVRNFAALGVLHTICELDRERLKELREQYPEANLQSNIHDVFQDEEIQGVVIATPAETHFKFARQALEMGKDVFVEKPLALSVEEGEQLVDHARRKERILMVGHILGYHPGILKLQELVKKGELGKINYVYSNRLNLGKFRTEENILWSFAPHDISVILLLLGEMPLEVSAHGGNYLQQEIADVTVTNMYFAGGARAHIFVSWLHPNKEQRLVIVGNEKMAVFDDTKPKDKLLVFDHKIDWIESVPVPNRSEAEPVNIQMEEPLKSEWQDFIDCVKERKGPKVDGAKGLQVLKVLSYCQSSLEKNGEVVSID